jgi:hypothetical protein
MRQPRLCFPTQQFCALCPMRVWALWQGAIRINGLLCGARHCRW